MDDLIGEFIEETSESLSMLDMELVKLEQNPNDKEILGNIFRLVHTIKGTCGFLGLPRLEAVAHAGENILGKIRDEEIPVSPEAISLVLRSLDAIRGLVEYLAEHGEEAAGDDAALIAELNAFVAAGGVVGAAPAAEADAALANDGAGTAPAGGIAADDPNLLEGGGHLSREELEALERAFMETDCDDADFSATVEPAASAESEGDSADDIASLLQDEESGEAAVEAAVPEPVSAPVADVSQKAKEQAVDKGLQATDKAAAPAASGGGVASQSIRVNIEVLENLMQMVGELVLTRNQLMQVVRHSDDAELLGPLQQLSHITTELQDGVMKTRMQPIGNAWSKFPRLIRDLSIDLDKKIELNMIGADTELDRQLLEMIKDPLTHMVRNSCDHGLEGPAERVEAGKGETGTVTLHAYHEGGHIIIEIRDDGRGINIDRVKQKAIDNGLATPEGLEELSDQQIAQFVFRAGFSTAEKVTNVSGRGVGMDVVRTNIEKIGGTVELISEPGKGSVFLIKIPLTLAIVSVLIVESGGEKFAMPQLNVLELVKAGRGSDHKIERINDSPVLRLREKLLPLVTLARALHLDDVVADGEEEKCAESGFIVVCAIGGYEFGVIVDNIYDTEEIVVKPVSKSLSDIDVYSGNTILGDGSVIMILDPNGLARETGDADTSSSNQDDANAAKLQVTGERVVKFLLFTAGDGAPKAVPLELVARLEEVDLTQVEHSSGGPVVQYRGGLMRLKTLDDSPIGTEGKSETIVFTYDHTVVGVLVDEVYDIVEAPIAVEMASEENIYLGSVVIAGKTTDVVDVGYVLSDLIDEHVEAPEGEDFDVLRGQRVLLVEDSPFFRKLMMPALGDVGCHVTACVSGLEALKILDANSDFDIIITDIEMPGMDGFQLADTLKGDSSKEMPIIAFTSTVNEQYITRASEVGMEDIVLKTDRVVLLRAMCRALVSQSQGEIA